MGAMIPNQRYIPAIDGLRAVAVLSVILYHAKAAWLPGGFTGVDVFFVISGYVVTGSLAREGTASFRQLLLNFYSRRILRIYPALLACLSVSVLLVVLFIPVSWLSHATKKTAVMAYAGLSNFALIWFNDGYFSPRVEFNAFTHTWSLAVEEQFYLLFPPLCFLWAWGSRRKGLSGVALRSLLPILLLTSLAFAAFQTKHSYDRAFYLLPSRFWELASGALLFRCHEKQWLLPKGSALSALLIASGLVLIGYGFYFTNPGGVPFPGALLPVAGTVLAIAGVASRSGGGLFGQALRLPVIVGIGKRSYSLYLWHWPLFVLFRWTLGMEQLSFVFCALTLTVLAAAVSYRFVETPFRKLKSLRPPLHVLRWGGGAILVCVAVSAVLLEHQSRFTLSVTSDFTNWYAYPFTNPNAKRNPQATLWSGHQVFVIGDSHGGAYSTMLQRLKEEEGVEVIQYTNSSCPMASLVAVPSSICHVYLEGVADDVIRKAKPNDVVFFAGLRMIRLCDQWNAVSPVAFEKAQREMAAPDFRKAVESQLEALVTRLLAAKLRVIVDAPKPVFRLPAFRCSDWFNSGNPICAGGPAVEKAQLLRMAEPVKASLAKLKKLYPEVIVWDPFPLLCPGEVCTPFDEEGKPLFFDGDHITAHANRKLYPSFKAALK